VEAAPRGAKPPKPEAPLLCKRLALRAWLCRLRGPAPAGPPDALTVGRPSECRCGGAAPVAPGARPWDAEVRTLCPELKREKAEEEEATDRPSASALARLWLWPHPLPLPMERVCVSREEEGGWYPERLAVAEDADAARVWVDAEAAPALPVTSVRDATEPCETGRLQVRDTRKPSCQSGAQPPDPSPPLRSVPLGPDAADEAAPGGDMVARDPGSAAQALGAAAAPVRASPPLHGACAKGLDAEGPAEHAANPVGEPGGANMLVTTVGPADNAEAAAALAQSLPPPVMLAATAKDSKPHRSASPASSSSMQACASRCRAVDPRLPWPLSVLSACGRASGAGACISLMGPPTGAGMRSPEVAAELAAGAKGCSRRRGRNEHRCHGCLTRTATMRRCRKNVTLATPTEIEHI